MIRRAALAVVVGLLSAAPATAHTITSGVITVGRGANGVEFGLQFGFGCRQSR